MSKLTFVDIHSEHIRDCFEQALAGYPPLHQHEIILQKKDITTTMRAQPVLDWSFPQRQKRKYKVEMSSRASLSSAIKLEALPRPVLVGWFAHELGHVMDYLNRSPLNIIGFGIGYVVFPTFRIGAERKADLYAIEYGFAREILATKKFILKHSTLPAAYKRRIERYYMSPDEVALLVNKDKEHLTDQLF